MAYVMYVAAWRRGISNIFLVSYFAAYCGGLAAAICGVSYLCDRRISAANSVGIGVSVRNGVADGGVTTHAGRRWRHRQY